MRRLLVSIGITFITLFSFSSLATAEDQSSLDDSVVNEQAWKKIEDSDLWKDFNKVVVNSEESNRYAEGIFTFGESSYPNKGWYFVGTEQNYLPYYGKIYYAQNGKASLFFEGEFIREIVGKSSFYLNDELVWKGLYYLGTPHFPINRPDFMLDPSSPEIKVEDTLLPEGKSPSEDVEKKRLNEIKIKNSAAQKFIGKIVWSDNIEGILNLEKLKIVKINYSNDYYNITFVKLNNSKFNYKYYGKDRDLNLKDDFYLSDPTTGLSKKVLEAIKNKKIILGMTQPQVIMAWGDPISMEWGRTYDDIIVWYSRQTLIYTKLTFKKSILIKIE